MCTNAISRSSIEGELLRCSAASAVLPIAMVVVACEQLGRPSELGSLQAPQNQGLGSGRVEEHV